MRLKLLLFVVVFAFGAVFGANVSVETQVSLIEGIKNSAAILFGVVGGWMALIYPDELKAAISSGTRPTKSAILFNAFYVASVSLGVAIVFPTLIHTAGELFPATLGPTLNRVGFSVILGTLLLQVWVLWLVLRSTELIRRKDLEVVRKAGAVRRLLNRKKKP